MADVDEPVDEPFAKPEEPEVLPDCEEPSAELEPLALPLPDAELPEEELLAEPEEPEPDAAPCEPEAEPDPFVSPLVEPAELPDCEEPLAELEAPSCCPASAAPGSEVVASW